MVNQMGWMQLSQWVCLALTLVVFSRVTAGEEVPERVDFARDIRPLLSNSCFTCHGPDEATREAFFRLDERASAVDEAGVIVPGDPDASRVVMRISETNERMRMPPPDSSQPPLTLEEIERVRRWIAEGAEYREHWSYTPLNRPAVPRVERTEWVRNPIDAFVARKHERRGVEPTSEADRRTWIRRLSFDLTGLPPSPEDVDAFIADDRPDAYERLVTRLIDSEHFGERMAMYWLDLVRYADSIGYHSDTSREVSLYRDYVIRSFNENLPFDQFTIEQLAGDLLPDGGPDQLVASGYNMLLQTTEEGGAQADEYLAKYSADRVRNLSDVWLGSTMGCAECHDHKYDPISAKDFYSMAAFFADIQEPGVGRRTETPILTPEQEAEQRELEELVAEVRRRLQAAEAEPAEGERAAGETAGAASLAVGEVGEAVAGDAAEAPAEAADSDLAPLQEELAAREKQLEQFQAALPRSLIPRSGSPREIRILPRGDWLDDSGPVVEPAVPEAWGGLEADKNRLTRLDLAQWLMDPDNPLVARTAANRLWALVFGAGLSRTLEDLGAQGEPPTHPELLDWLAVEYRDSGWDTKQLLTLMVTSSTYRQASLASAELRRRDPDNRWLARQSSYRLDAEMVRDNALAVSGLLVRTIGGPSVKPYQPAGYWAHLNFPKREWPQGQGDDLYRRGLYTHWQRSFLHPSLMAFDAPSREECTAQRVRSNTPQQALVLLNDPTYVEAARALAERIVREADDSPAQRLDFAFRQVLARSPDDEEREVLLGLFQSHAEHYQQAPAAAEQLLNVGDKPRPADLDAGELAAWTSVARVLLNLPEGILRY